MKEVLKETTDSENCLPLFLLLPPPDRVLKPKVGCRYKRELKVEDLKTPYMLIAV